jgi:hypothetical protein
MNESAMDALYLAELPAFGRMSPSDLSLGSVRIDFDFLEPSSKCDEGVDDDCDDVLLTPYRRTTPSQPDCIMVPLSPTSSSKLVSLASLIHMTSTDSSGTPEKAPVTPDSHQSLFAPFPIQVSAKRKHREPTCCFDLELISEEVADTEPPLDLLEHLDDALIVTDDDFSHDADDASPTKKSKHEEQAQVLSADDPNAKLHYACACATQSKEAIEAILKTDPLSCGHYSTVEAEI